MEQLKDNMIRKGLRPSLQRLKVLEYLMRHRTHPSAETIFLALRRAVPTLSRMTVYNSLHQLARHGLIAELTIVGNNNCYDFKCAGHPHFLCKVCTKVIDLEEVNFPKVKKTIGGNLIEEAHFYFKGLCRACALKRQKD